MPRRGDHQREFPPVKREAAVERIGRRVVSAPDRTGTMRAIVLDPSVFRCAVLAGELADEWVDYVDITNVTGSWAGIRAPGDTRLLHACRLQAGRARRGGRLGQTAP